MLNQVVCKMQCNEVPAEANLQDDSVQSIGLGCVYEPDEGKRQLPENAVFGKYTPWGSFRAGIGNPAAKQFFKPGKKYYVTFTEAPD
jgi:hypothetical protein